MSDELMTPEAEEAAFAPMSARIRALEAGRDTEQHALRNALGIIQQLEVDLARALPVVEAAGALVERWRSGHLMPYAADGDPSVVLLDALARAVDAGKGTG